MHIIVNCDIWNCVFGGQTLQCGLLCLLFNSINLISIFQMNISNIHSVQYFSVRGNCVWSAVMFVTLRDIHKVCFRHFLVKCFIMSKCLWTDVIVKALH